MESRKKIEALELEKENLKKRLAEIETELNDLRNVYVFEAHYTNDVRKGKPYVARLFFDKEKNNIGREFIPLSQNYGKKDITVSGSYEAKEGEYFEIREGGSWKNDYRYFFKVVQGRLEKIGDSQNSKDKSDILELLK